MSVATGTAFAATANQEPTALTTAPGDAFANYDFDSKSFRRDNVDWAISLYIYNGASIDRFKAMLDHQGFGANSTTGDKYGLGNDGDGYKWDTDHGKKGVECPTAGRSTRHYRVYADNDQYMYHPNVGTYIIGSTHRDYSECATSGKKAYDSEAVENDIVNIMSYIGCPTYHDYAWYYNREPYRYQGSHGWDNNGYASYINTGYTYCR